MDRNKVSTLENLITDKLSKFSESVVKIQDASIVHVEFSIKFRNDKELDAAIDLLQQLTP